MTTQPPSPEAVEAAMRYAKDEPLEKGDLKLIGLDENDNRYMVGMDAAAYILAAEVERLRAELDRRHKEYSAALNRRCAVEDVLYDVAAGKRDLLAREECKELAIKLGVPPAEK